MKHRLVRLSRPTGAEAGDSMSVLTRNMLAARTQSLNRSIGNLFALCPFLLLLMLVAQACNGQESSASTPEVIGSPSPSSTHTTIPTDTTEVVPSPSASQSDTPTPTGTKEMVPSPSPTRAETPTPDATPTEEAPSPIATREVSPSPSPVPLGQPHYDSRDDFELRPPDGWAVDESGTHGARIIFHSTTPDLHEETPFNANINVVIVPAQGDALDDIVAASKEQLALTFADFSLLGETFLIIDQLEARGFEYTFTQGALPLRIIQIVAVHEDKIYVVSATALGVAWDKYEGAFDASLRSFRILDGPPSPTPTGTPTPTATQVAAPSPSLTSTHTPTPVATPTEESLTATATTEVAISPSPAVLDQPYSDTREGFEVRPPYGWVADESGLLGTKVIFHGEMPDLHDDTPFVANIVVQVGPTHGFTLEQIVEESKKQSSLQLTDFDLLGDESVIVNGQKARLLDFTFVHGVLPLRSRQLLVVYEDKAYAITAGSLEAAWEEHEAAFDASLHSFRLLDVEDSEGS